MIHCTFVEITLHWIYDIKQTTTTKPFIPSQVTEITDISSLCLDIRTNWWQPSWSFDKGNFCGTIKILSPLASWSLLVNLYRPVAHMVTSQCNLQNSAIEDTRETNSEPVINLAVICGILIEAYHYSRLPKLLNVTVYVRCFCHNLNHPQDKITGPITAKELSDSTMLRTKASQQQEYFEEITNLTSKLAKRTLLVRQLRLFLDSRGFLCCGGRIHNAPISKLAKFPYL